MLNRYLYTALLFCLGCETTEVSTSTRCIIDVPAITNTLYFGQPATIQAYPLTEKWDTLVELNGTEAEVTAVTKDECEECEECRDINACTDCDYCSACTESCQLCEHSVTIIVPMEIATEPQLVITNAHGTSDPQTVFIEDVSDE